MNPPLSVTSTDVFSWSDDMYVSIEACEHQGGVSLMGMHPYADMTR